MNIYSEKHRITYTVRIRILVRIMRLMGRRTCSKYGNANGDFDGLVDVAIFLLFFRTFAGRCGLLSPFNQMMSLYRNFGVRYLDLIQFSLLSEYFFYFYVS